MVWWSQNFKKTQHAQNTTMAPVEEKEYMDQFIVVRRNESLHDFSFRVKHYHYYYKHVIEKTIVKPFSSIILKKSCRIVEMRHRDTYTLPTKKTFQQRIIANVSQSTKLFTHNKQFQRSASVVMET